MRVLPANVIPVWLIKENDQTMPTVSGFSAEIRTTVINLTAEESEGQ
jgi:hypothetical protein